MRQPVTRLYLITPPQLPGDFADTLARVLAAGDVGCVQLRLKDADDDQVLDAAAALGEVCQHASVPLVLNDRPDLAKTAGVDGVHVGQDDAPYAQARAAVGEGAIVGVTCHDSRHLAVAAAQAGADYVAFGAFFDTATKAAKSHADVGLIEWWNGLVEVPCVAIGGITVENCQPLVRAGADFLAVSSGVWEYGRGPAQAVADFNQAIAADFGGLV
jgi:thiamine-phosphate pyrophosphorylase